MNLDKNKIFIGILGFIIISNLMVFYNIQFLYFRAFLTFLFLIITPGLLIMIILGINKVLFWEYFAYTISISISFLLFVGLALNWILPLVRITNEPLILTPLILSFDIVLLILLLFGFIRCKNLVLEVKIPSANLINKLFIIIPGTFPFLSILGSTSLNNGGSNSFTMILLGGIGVYTLLIALLRNKLKYYVFPWGILMISIALLLMYSLRSWHILGYDINHEYHVFQLTKINHYWSYLDFSNAYNACLSITILPTIISSFLNINNEYIFKLIFPLLFSIVPVIIFLFLNRYTKPIIAFIASFFFMSQYQFMQQMTALARQEIALLFFGSSLLILFNNNIEPKLKNLLFLLFGFSMIVSHYSTAYIALLLYAFTFLIVQIIRKTNLRIVLLSINKKFGIKSDNKNSNNRKYYLNGFSILLLFAFAYLWYSQLTGISNNLVASIDKSIKNMGGIFKQDFKSKEAKSALFGYTNMYSVKDVQSYTKNIINDYHNNKLYINYYSLEQYKKFIPVPIYSKNIPISNQILNNIIFYTSEIVKKSIKIFILVGVLYLLIIQFKKRSIDREIVILNLGFIILIGTILLVPYVSIYYNFERLYQQSLVILALPAALGVLVFLRFIKNENIKIVILYIIFIVYFLPYSGFTSQLAGGEAVTQLNNFGEDYDRFYTHDSEIKSLEFLSNIYTANDLIYINKYALLKLYAFSGINSKNILTEILASTIDKKAYVYSSYTNTVANKISTYYNFVGLSYSYPTLFLNMNKNLIYNNGGSIIYK